MAKVKAMEPKEYLAVVAEEVLVELMAVRLLVLTGATVVLLVDMVMVEVLLPAL